jgi:hypothetical protein
MEVVNHLWDDLAEEPDDHLAHALPADLNLEEEFARYLGLELHVTLQQQTKANSTTTQRLAPSTELQQLVHGLMEGEQVRIPSLSDPAELIKEEIKLTWSH